MAAAADFIGPLWAWVLEDAILPEGGAVPRDRMFPVVSLTQEAMTGKVLHIVLNVDGQYVSFENESVQICMFSAN